MERYQVVGKREDGAAVLAEFFYRPLTAGRLILSVDSQVYASTIGCGPDGQLRARLVRHNDRACFTVPVLRSIAQLRARTRVTREPRRLYREEPEQDRHFTSYMAREGL